MSRSTHELHRPVPDGVYTTRQIYEQLNLPDDPALQVWTMDGYQPIQTSHVTSEQILALPGVAELKWEFKWITREEIPIFRYFFLDLDIGDFITVEDSVCEFDKPRTKWICFKGLYRKQYEIAIAEQQIYEDVMRDLNDRLFAVRHEIDQLRAAIQNSHTEGAKWIFREQLGFAKDLMARLDKCQISLVNLMKA